LPVVLGEPEYGDGPGDDADNDADNDADGPTVTIAGTPVAIAGDRLGPLAGIAVSDVRTLSQVFGLLRYDSGRWQFQPLVGKHNKRFLGPGAGIAQGLKLNKSSSTLATLQERAGKLLRES
jgi:hypothetical protein